MEIMAFHGIFGWKTVGKPYGKLGFGPRLGSRRCSQSAAKVESLGKSKNHRKHHENL